MLKQIVTRFSRVGENVLGHTCGRILVRGKDLEQQALPNIQEISIRNIRSFVQGKRTLKASWFFWLLGVLAYSLVLTFFGVFSLALISGNAVVWFIKWRDLFIFPFHIVAFVAIWRSSVNTKYRFWFFFARTVAVLLVILFGLVALAPIFITNEVPK